jgi:carbonic anhydrase
LSVKKNPELKPLVIAYKPSTANLVNNGKWISVRVEPGSFVNVAGDMFELLEVRLRSPSEHRVRGLHFPLEAQLIHKSGRGGRMGISVSLVEGATNHILSKLVGSLPVLQGRVAVPNVKINWIDFLPERLGYFTYRGSSTVPPCEQAWTWFVMTDYLQADLNQINTLRSLFPAGNDREPQPVFDRVVEEYTPAGAAEAASSAADHGSASASSGSAAGHAAPAAHH